MLRPTLKYITSQKLEISSNTWKFPFQYNNMISWVSPLATAHNHFVLQLLGNDLNKIDFQIHAKKSTLSSMLPFTFFIQLQFMPVPACAPQLQAWFIYALRYFMLLLCVCVCISTSTSIYISHRIYLYSFIAPRGVAFW